jgi:TctA family transporter
VFGGAWGACAFIIQPVVGGYASCLGLVVVLSLYGRIVLAFVPQSYFYLKALELLGVSVFKKTMKKR